MTTGATHRPITARAAVLAVLGLGLALSGCSGSSGSGSDSHPSGSSSSASPSATASASASASATPAAEKAPVAPPARPGKAGQKAFAEHVMAVWGYGLRTDDARPLTSLSRPGASCRGCSGFSATLRSRRKQGWHVDFDGVGLRSISTRKVGPNTYARAVVDIPASDSLNADGSFRNTNKSHRDATFEVLMHLQGKHYRLLAFTVS